MKKLGFAILIIGLFISESKAQKLVSAPFDSTTWDLEDAQFVYKKHAGKDGILLTGGSLVLKDVQFLNGTIELDMKFSNQRNFPGILFRMVGPGDFEQFYIRPHQSGNPDANQYTPVFNGTAGWQLYHGEEWATAIIYDYTKWHHIKIVVMGGKADIYFDDMDKVMLKVDLLRDIAAGELGLNTGIAPVYYANFQYTLTDGPSSAEPMASTAVATAITSWEVSNVIADSLITGKYQLDKSFKSGLKWNTYPSESIGVINLARYGQRSEGSTTIVVKVNVDSEREQVKRLDFGFSDKVRVYLNDKAIFEGHDRFVSRDYRYLGTIGFFDTVFLPLKKGKNELLFTVTEAFGGWGLQAKWENLEGISFK